MDPEHIHGKQKVVIVFAKLFDVFSADAVNTLGRLKK